MSSRPSFSRRASAAVKRALDSLLPLPTALQVAVVGALLTLLLATVVPWLLPGGVRYSTSVAVTSAMAVAIIITAGYAAENLRILRETWEAEYTPAIHARLSIDLPRKAMRRFRIRLRNVGRGMAWDLEGFVWWQDEEQLMWVPNGLFGIKDVLESGDVTERIESLPPYMNPRVRQRSDPPVPDIVLTLRYLDALDRKHEVAKGFDFVRDWNWDAPMITTSPHPVPHQLDSMEAKRRHLGEAVAALESEMGLPQHGLSIRWKMGERAIWVSIYKDGQRLRGTQYGISPSVTRIARETRERLQAVLERLEPGSGD